MSQFALLTSVQAVMTLAFYIGALVFVVTRRDRLTRRAAALATWGVGLLLAGWVITIAWPFVVSGYTSTIGSSSEVVAVVTVMSFVSGAIHLAAILLLLLALFDGRTASPYGPAAPEFPLPPQPGLEPPAVGGIPPWPGQDRA